MPRAKAAVVVLMHPRMSDNLKHLHSKIDQFYSSGYLSTWCSSVRKEWTEFLDRAFSMIIPPLIDQNEPVIIDIGCGPSISNIISASKLSQRIYLADYLESNRLEVERFWKSAENGFSWDHYFRFVGVLELQPDMQMIEERTRNSIRGVYFCDVTIPQVFVVKISADILIASLVLDVVAITDKMFTSCLKNMLNYLNTSGILIIQGSLHEKVYTVGSSMFPVMDIDEARLLNIFQQCDLKLIKFELCVKISTHYFAILQKSN